MTTPLTDPDLIARRDRSMARLRRQWLGTDAAEPFYLWGRRGVGQANPLSDPEAWMTEALADLASHGYLLEDEDTFRPLVIEYGPYGVHFIDHILGAHVYELREPENWQARYLDSPVGSLRPPDLEASEAWSQARALAQAFLDSGATVPLFGMPTLSSALNIYLNLYGPGGLLVLVDDPEAARHDLRVIQDVILAVHRWYLEHIPAQQLQPVVADHRTQPPGFGQLCGCSTQLLSPATYAELIAPLDDELLSLYPEGGMIHLCGGHTQHMETWRDMASLRAVQVNDRAAGDLDAYVGGLREDQVLYVNPCQEMPLREALEITRGRPAVMVGERPPA
ncbi:MAG: hypothetical protein GF320_06675 [Armatimonadia bacterium]|nr:hypothetical protein [Armatimonadia bacterium]